MEARGVQGRLLPVQRSELPRLVAMLEADLPNTIHPYCFLKCVIDWKKKTASVVSDVLAPGGDFTDSTFMLYTVIGGMFICTAFSKSENGRRRLGGGLAYTLRTLLAGRSTYLFTCLVPEMEAVVVEALREVLQDADGIHCSHDTVYWMPLLEARNIPSSRLPEGVTLRALDRGHVQQINDLYPYRYPGSEEIMESSITLNGGLGAFRGDSLLSWAMASYYLGLGVVQTLKEERNRGLGEYVVRETTRMMAEKLHVPVHLNVVEGNRTALRFFHSLGFHQLYTSTWIYPKTRKYYDA